ncbi:DUF5700 domain-containing putative Zn-dependent protease [Peribacillus sp. NPDC097295]|uniref:DUF5700 domain-containing putative Zn-dependent protease n=1 Tax=Peribacillus sp. NPDC097295 TaxID=3364402 RepID=UPI0038063068
MLKLDVSLDASLINFVENHKKQPTELEWFEYCKANEIPYLANQSLFDEEKKLGSYEIESLSRTVKYLEVHLEDSVKHIAQFFPDTPKDIDHHLKIGLLPYGKKNFGPKSSLQLFSLFPEATPVETYLFLIHIYYHEISFINYTDFCKECSVSPDTPEKLKHFIINLIQNEGIGNFAVLESLIEYREQNSSYDFKYFSYASMIRDEVSIVQSMSLLRQILDTVNESNYANYQGKINLILKNKRLPIINLVGTHMAESIVATHGLDALRNVYKRSPKEFFNLYFDTKDPLKEHLSKGEYFLNSTFSK